MKRFAFICALLCGILTSSSTAAPATQPALSADQLATVQAAINKTLADLAQPATQPATQPADRGPEFLVGVWYQPASSFPKWKARGITTLVGYESEGGNVSLDRWKQAAAVAGLRIMLQADACRDQDFADPAVIAILAQPDEPDGAGATTPAEMQARTRAVKLRTAKPVLVQLDGWKMQWRPAADYIAYGLAGDWLSMDFYPVNRGTPQLVGQIGDRLDDLKRYAPGKRLLACIECSDQNLRVQDWAQDSTWGPMPALTMRAPTAAEVAGQVKLAVNHGATGIIYFPDIIGRKFEGFDGTPADIAAAMPAINAGR